ncbi:MAG: class I SAM-dependent methyltransferase, partial [Candidatus Saccharibacteria bacterium]
MNHRETVINNFGSAAANYRSSTIHGNAEKLAQMVQLLGVQTEYVVLDVATGAGHTALALAPQVKQVTAIDITGQMLAQARAETEIRGLDNIDFIEADVHKLPFADDVFDVVACRYAAHHFSEIQTAIDEMHRVLKPGGRLYILDCSVVGDAATKDIVNKAETLRDDSHICLYSKEEWKTMLAKAGFQVKHSEVQRTLYLLPLWFDTIETPGENRKEVLRVL